MEGPVVYIPGDEVDENSFVIIFADYEAAFAYASVQAVPYRLLPIKERST